MMKTYLEIAPKYLSAHARRTRLAVLSVVMSVALVVGIFSMLDSLVKFEREQVLRTEGNYHILVRHLSDEEKDLIRSRIDVQNAGTLKDLGYGSLNGERCALGSLDENFSKNLNFEVVEGRYPAGEHEIMLEQWAMEKLKLSVGDAITLTLPDVQAQEVAISGVYKDLGATKAAGIPIVFVPMSTASTLAPVSNDFFIQFKDGVDILKAEDSIKASLNISDDHIARNEGLLALMLQTKNNRAIKIYAIGVVLFFLVLVTAVVMIYNTFNISVLERMRQFGLLRCIGASKAQIIRLVIQEGLSICLRAIPIGVLAGMLMTLAGSAVLKFYNPAIYGNISLLNFSLLGIGSGVAIGLLTVLIASLLPANKASHVSPVSALRGLDETRGLKKHKQGLLMKLLYADIAIGIHNAVDKKRTLFLMSASIALSIILFFGFNFLVNPTYMGVRPVKAYTADVSLTSGAGVSPDLYARVSKLEGVKKVYGRMGSFVNASFDPARLSDSYKKLVGAVQTDSSGLLVAPENSWLISYDASQLAWAKDYLSSGEVDETQLNAHHGILAVRKIYRGNNLVDTTALQIGDRVFIKTVSGSKEFTVMGIMDTVPYSVDDLSMTTFITTEKLFAEVTSDTAYKTVDIQLASGSQEETVSQIKKLAGDTAAVLDKRQFNTEANNSFMTVAIFIYGFVGVIALISVLNIINTMNTSVAAKTRYLGVMRAVGMSADQLTRMVVTEAAIYSLTGCFAGCVLGVLLQKGLSDFFIADWKFPFLQVVLVVIVSLATAALSTTGPLKRIQEKGIAETIGGM